MIHQAYLGDYLRASPRGLDTEIMEGGSNLSDGQKQAL